MSTNGTPEPSRILSLDGKTTGANKPRDDQGRVLSHNATVLEAHEIAIEEGNKVLAHHFNQIPDFVARMIHDSLLHYGLIAPVAPVDITPAGPSDNIKVEEPAEQVSGDAESTPAPVAQS